VSRFTASGAVYPFEASDTGRWAWVLAEPLPWEIRDAAGTVTGQIVVPAGFLTDLGSVPWWARSLVNPADPQCAKAYVLHDWCLDCGGPLRQLEAAGVLHEALRALRVEGWRRNLPVLGAIAGIDRW
jgi:hypothetical protein